MIPISARLLVGPFLKIFSAFVIFKSALYSSTAAFSNKVGFVFMDQQRWFGQRTVETADVLEEEAEKAAVCQLY